MDDLNEELREISEKIGYKTSELLELENQREDIKKEIESPIFYYFVMIGSEGVEGYFVTRNKNEIPDKCGSGELRARINSHRNIKGYVFLFNKLIPTELIDQDFLDEHGGVPLF